MNEDNKKSKVGESIKSTSANAAGTLFVKGGKKVAKKIGKGAVKIAGKLGLKAAAQAIGSSLPIIGNAIAYVGEWLLEKVLAKIYNFIKKHAKEFAMALGGMGLAVAGYGALVGSAAALTTGVVMAGIAGAQAISAFLLLLMNAWVIPALASLLIPLLIILIGIPMAIVFILFIINTSAFMVPPGPRLGGQTAPLPSVEESLYIDVEKTAEPQGGFANDALAQGQGQVITYTIEVTAVSTILENISYEYSCAVYQESGQSNCPDTTNPNPPLPDPPQSIDPGETISFSYTQRYTGTGVPGEGLSDSYILDTITVTADSPEEPNTSETASAFVSFGNPPFGCVVFAGNWPSTYRAALQEAAFYILSNHTSYMQQVCAGGEIPQCYSFSSSAYWGVHLHGSSCDVRWHNGDSWNSLQNASFIAGHEWAHHISTIDGGPDGIYSQYLHYCSPTGCIVDELTPGICSYPVRDSSGNVAPAESFAEAIGVYISEPSYWDAVCPGIPDLQTGYPVHYEFVQNVVMQ